MTRITIAKNEKDLGIPLQYLNRHGFITGATGTGKTVTLKVIAEQLSKQGIPVFLADIKGDLASLSQAGDADKMKDRLEKLGITDYTAQPFPVHLWDVYGELGHPVRGTISEMGPILLSRLFELSDTQADVLQVLFKIADDKGYLLIDLKDLQSLVTEVSNHLPDYTGEYGHITKQTLGAIQRHLLTIQEQGGDLFFGEPAIKLTDFIRQDDTGKGYLNILMAQKLYQNPLLYATMLIWLLAQLFEELPEVGDLDKPKLVFFFDEAHLLFNDMPKSLVSQVEKVVRLIRSKGVGVYFVTQNPIDLPESILAQLGNRIQHALRAYTPKEQKAIKAAADSYRPNENFKVADVITELQVGEALISFLDDTGTPSIVERAMVRPPESFLGTVDETQYKKLIETSPFDAQYRSPVDRESAYELLSKKIDAEREEEAKEKLQKELEKEEKLKEKAKKKKPKGAVEKIADSFTNQLIRSIGREMSRSVLGIFKRK
ncbi:helicase HerA-like domain-containing protein [Vagococcus fessus]|uniref:ATP-binding protein n=1 Tax=Vagococcus fessus TaxID=120370 RepID=A0A430ACC0_9ENTE|nr:helicase HerA-like domain-containing protein [Vagococcus fessus]RSU04865.1 ATP-binding protein [Vagococcus fessus]